MAINKVINKSTKSHGAMRNVIEYVLRDDKVKEGYVYITGPYAADTINYDSVYNAFLNEKNLWNKDSGRMYSHCIISFHRDEQIVPEKVLEIGKQFVDKFFTGYQCLISVHQDKDHLHCHIVVNSVSYLNGLKLHQTKHDLEKQKNYTNNLCMANGLTVAIKGYHFDGSKIEDGKVSAWNKDKYNLLNQNGRKSYVSDCAAAVQRAKENCCNQEDFIDNLLSLGWSTVWNNKKKHITFQNKNGDKVRDSNLSNTFRLSISKEGLMQGFEKQAKIRDAREKAKYDSDKMANIYNIYNNEELESNDSYDDYS